jgi:hypothetical protein
MGNNRYFLTLIGSTKGIDEDLNFIADSEDGVNYVDGNGIFMATFYSPYKTDEIYNLLAHRNAYLIFDITNNVNYGVNLPKKFYKGLFPEIDQIIPEVESYSKDSTPEINQDELTDINEILDKLSKNNYDTSCLTKKELKILNDC